MKYDDRLPGISATGKVGVVFSILEESSAPAPSTPASLQGKIIAPKYRISFASESKHNMRPTTSLVATLIGVAPIVSAGPAAYGICQAGCAAVVTACYAAAGFTWGATMGASAPATVIGCNTAFGACQAACWAAAIAPTP
ncbi:hypothetical protein F4678DRAFT_460143 [Xylaria arbuscula]|nr:hypothetical protein F4678DRAFT_460143 [Xylaria arbuscula]